MLQSTAAAVQFENMNDSGRSLRVSTISHRLLAGRDKGLPAPAKGCTAGTHIPELLTVLEPGEPAAETFSIGARSSTLHVCCTAAGAGKGYAVSAAIAPSPRQGQG